MFDSIHDNLPFWAFWFTITVIAVHQVVRSLRSPVGILGFVPVICTMYSYVFILQGAVVGSTMTNRVRPEILSMGMLVSLLCLLGMLFGWSKGVGTVVPAKPSPPPPQLGRRLWSGGVIAMLIGIVAQYYFFIVERSDFNNTSAYVYLLFHVAFPGMAICTYLASSDVEYRKGNNILFLLILTTLFILPWVYAVRRGPVFSFVIIGVYSFYLARPRKVNRGMILGGLAFAGILMLFFFSIRDYAADGTWGGWRLQNVTVSNVLLKKAYDEDDNEFLYNCCMIATVSELERYQWGTSYLSLASHWIPRSWWPDKPAMATGWLDPPNWSDMHDITGILPTPGSSASGIGEAFVEFSWLSPLFWAGLTWTFGRIYRLALLKPWSIWPSIYLGLLAASHHLITQGFAAFFVPVVCYIIVPLVIHGVAGNLTGSSAPPKRVVRRPVSAGQLGHA